METAQDLDELCTRVEVAIFAGGGPGFSARLRKLISISQGQLDAVVGKINEALAERGRPYEIVSVAGGYQFRTRPEWGEFLAELQPERKQRLSPAALDTLAVIAYRQPITRAEIEELRSVDCDGVLRSLIERRFVRVAGRKDAPGKPALYGTTPYFLEAFGMQALHDLPPLRNLAEEAAGQGVAVEQNGAATSDEVRALVDPGAPGETPSASNGASEAQPPVPAEFAEVAEVADSDSDSEAGVDSASAEADAAHSAEASDATPDAVAAPEPGPEVSGAGGELTDEPPEEEPEEPRGGAPSEN